MSHRGGLVALIVLTVVWGLLLPGIGVQSMFGLDDRWPENLPEQLEQISLWFQIISGLAVAPIGWLLFCIPYTRRSAPIVATLLLVGYFFAMFMGAIIEQRFNLH